MIKVCAFHTVIEIFKNEVRNSYAIELEDLQRELAKMPDVTSFTFINDCHSQINK